MRRATRIILTSMLAAGLVFGSAVLPYTYAYADSSVTNYEKTAIEDDLKDVDAGLYPANPNGMHRLIDGIGFTEYAYSTSVFANQYYGIYLYVYSPTERPLAERAGVHVANVAVAYNEAGEPSSYENVALKLLDETENHRFFKFGLADQRAAYARARAYADRHDGVRRYDIAGVQLWFQGEESATDANTDRDDTSYTYLCTGYAKGCSDESAEESTLDIERQELRTLQLDVHHTYYRPDGTNGKGLFTHDSLNSIYFSVPNEIIEKYGEMTGIKGQYLRARTTDIYVTGTKSIYDKLLPYVGLDVGYQNDGINDGNDIMIGAIAGTYNGIGTAVNWTYNTSEGFANTIRKLEGGRYFSRMNYLFYAENGNADVYDVSTEQLADWMKNYTAANKTDEALVGGKFHPDLFSEVDGSVTVFDITAEDKTAGFQTVKVSQNWWQKFTGQVTQKPSVLYEGTEAIHRVVDDDFVYTVGTTDVNKKATGDKLYIAQTDVEEFAEYYATHKSDNYVYKIAFAVDDYVSGEARQGKFLTAGVSDSFDYWASTTKDTNAWLALEWVYLNFEIIETRFGVIGNETVIPVVMSPIDIIPDATHPSVTRKDRDWRLVIWLSVVVGGLIVVGVAAAIIKKNSTERRD